MLNLHSLVVLSGGLYEHVQAVCWSGC